MGMQKLLLGLVFFGCAGVWAADVPAEARGAKSIKHVDRLPIELSYAVQGFASTNHLAEFPNIIKRLTTTVNFSFFSNEVYWSPDDQYVACVSDEAVFVVEPFTGNVRSRLAYDGVDRRGWGEDFDTPVPLRASWGPDNQLAVGYSNGDIVIWNALSGIQKKQLLCPFGEEDFGININSLVWGQGDIVSCDLGGYAARWDASRDWQPHVVSSAIMSDLKQVFYGRAGMYAYWSNKKRLLAYAFYKAFVLDGDQLRPVDDQLQPYNAESYLFPNCWSRDDRFIMSIDSASSRVADVYDMFMKKRILSIQNDYHDGRWDDCNWGAGGLLGIVSIDKDNLGEKSFLIIDVYKNDILYREKIKYLSAFAWSTRGDYLLLFYEKKARIMPTALGAFSIQEYMVLKDINEALADPAQKFVLLAGGELNNELLKKLWPVVITVKEICDIALDKMQTSPHSSRSYDLLRTIAPFDLPVSPDAQAELIPVLQEISEQCGAPSSDPRYSGKGVAELTDAQLAVLQQYPALYEIVKPYVVSAGDPAVAQGLWRAGGGHNSDEAREREAEA